MITKPKKYDEIQVNEDFVPVKLGGHKGVIMGVEEYTSPVSKNTSLKVCIDLDKTDEQAGYFAEQYRNDTRTDKKWSNAATKYVSLGEDENQVKMLKGFITAIENSNNGFTYDWKKEVDQLKGKKVGLVFGLEEYEDNEGNIKTATKLNQFRSIDKLDNVKIPKVKLLNGGTMEYEDYKNQTTLTNVKNTTDAVEISDDNLPF